MKKYTLAFYIGRSTLKLVTFLVFVTGPVFLPLLAAPPETTYEFTHGTISDFS
jgi:hypothetical protein